MFYNKIAVFEGGIVPVIKITIHVGLKLKCCLFILLEEK